MGSGASIQIRSGSRSGRIVSTVVGLLLTVAGGYFTYLVAASLLRDSARGWQPAECTLESARVEENAEGAEPFRVSVSYRYVAFGREHTGTVLRPGYNGGKDMAEADRLAERYRAGTVAPCWVNPKNPAAATLEPARLTRGFFILFPLAFFLAGLGMLTVLWRPSRQDRHPSADLLLDPDELPRASRKTPISERAKGALGGNGGAGCLALFFSLFALVGGGVGLFFLLPALKVVQARSWSAVPCMVESSQVASHSGDDSTTYSVDVRYRYELEGKPYRGNRYQFLGGSSSGYAAKQAVVDRLPAGTATTCFVNPEDPYDAVIERGFNKGYWVALVPLLFFGVGVGGMFFALRSAVRRRSTKPTHRDWLPDGVVAGPEINEPMVLSSLPRASVTLKPQSGPIGRFVGMTFVALFWNGITGVFVFKAYEGWSQGQGDGCLTLFMVPFVLIGLALLSSVPYSFLALFNPRPVLTLSRPLLPLGATTELGWHFKGWPSRIQRLKITLEGKEEASYRQGTRTSTAQSVFARLELADRTDSMDIVSGSVPIALPADTMHSFSTGHNKIVWTLKLQGEIRGWPDVAEDVPVTVVPSRGVS